MKIQYNKCEEFNQNNQLIKKANNRTPANVGTHFNSAGVG
jgi:hypothetical protein